MELQSTDPEFYRQLPGFAKIIAEAESALVARRDYYPEQLANNFPTVAPVRYSFEKNVRYIQHYLRGTGMDMGCGSCPLLMPNCVHVDHSEQPFAVAQLLDMPNSKVYKGDATKAHMWTGVMVNYIFSSHMVEDLGSRFEILSCIKNWGEWIYLNGHIVLLVPDMQGGRYPTVEQGANPSHKTNVGVPFFLDLANDLPNLEIVQIDTIPHEFSDTLDVVFKRVK